MLDYLLRKEHVDKVHNFATFETFQKHYLTPEGSRFYFDVFGYDGDLDGSPEGVVEFYEQLAALTGKEIRPLRGMSAFIEALAKSARGLGTKIFTGDNHKILSIDKQTNQFVLKTSQYEVSVGKLVVAAPPGAFGSVSGSVAEQIQRAPEFQSILPRPAFKGAAVYPTAWWEEITNVKDKLYPMERFLSNSDCLGWTLPHRWGLLTRYTCIFSSIYIKAPYRLRIISFLKRYNIIIFFLFSKGLGFDSSWVPALWQGEKAIFFLLILIPNLKIPIFSKIVSFITSGSGRNGEAVLHVAYTDGVCGEKWGEILKSPKDVMDREIHRALEYKFNRKIPKPLSTVYQYWNEGAW